jgi:hypothetical protein
VTSYLLFLSKVNANSSIQQSSTHQTKTKTSNPTPPAAEQQWENGSDFGSASQILALGFLLSLESPPTLSSSPQSVPHHTRTSPQPQSNPIHPLHLFQPIVIVIVRDHLHPTGPVQSLTSFTKREKASRGTAVREAESRVVDRVVSYHTQVRQQASKKYVFGGTITTASLLVARGAVVVAEKVRLARSRSHHCSIASWNSHTTVLQVRNALLQAAGRKRAGCVFLSF